MKLKKFLSMFKEKPRRLTGAEALAKGLIEFRSSDKLGPGDELYLGELTIRYGDESKAFIGEQKDGSIVIVDIEE